MQRIEEVCALGSAEKEIMEKAYERLGLSARSYHKVLRVARTIADLDGKVEIEGKHLREALSYRNMDYGYRRH
jgi:magnesium chelatase family protein